MWLCQTSLVASFSTRLNVNRRASHGELRLSTRRTMTNHLPDEIISEILTPVLKVPDEAFSDNSQDSPFSKCTESSSAFLLVCKSWLRVSTPLLYHVVVLRSTAQAAALARALILNPELGRFIKKLRLEGGYGDRVDRIIQAAPNVIELCFPLSIWSNDDPHGLVNGLLSMKPGPTRVILLDDSNVRFNKNSQLVYNAFTMCLGIWKNLTILDVPWDDYYLCRDKLAVLEVVKDTPNIKTVRILPPAFSTWSPRVPRYLELIAENKFLSSIQLKTRDRAFYSRHATILTDPSLRGLVEMPEMNLDHVFPLQFFTAVVPEHIWDRILGFAMVLEFLEDVKYRKNWTRGRIHILLVSKLFARLGLPHYHDSLGFRQTDNFNQFVLRTNSSSPCSRVGTLYLNMEKPPHLNWSAVLPNIKLVNLKRRVDAPVCIDFREFVDLGKYSGATLVTLEGIEVNTAWSPQKPDVFSLFPQLRSLSIGCRAEFDATTVPSGALPCLEELTLSFVQESVVLAMAQMDLPALRSVSFTLAANPGPFFEKHGSKLRSAAVWVMDMDVDSTNVFDLCPSMVEFTLFCGEYVPDPVQLAANTPHISLRNITLRTTGGKTRRGLQKTWQQFLDSLEVDTFPVLEQITLPIIDWPTTEFDTRKSIWVDPAERLLDSGVTLKNLAGVGWRRRLK